MNEELLIKLRDCFTAGYTLPQYCIDNGIKRPLIVSEEKYALLLWEIYVQFCYDKRLTAQFSLIDNPSFKMNHSVRATLWSLRTKEFTKDLLARHDKIIVLLSDRDKVRSNKAVYPGALTDYFIRKTYYEIPLLHFLQRHPKVKLILTNVPDIAQYEGGQEYNTTLPTYEDLIANLRDENSKKIKTTLDRFRYTRKEQLAISLYPKTTKNPDGSTTLTDDESPLRRIQDGKRATVNQPKQFRNKIWFVGSSHYYGVHAPYSKTIESYLQKMLNKAKLPWRVENEGQVYWGAHQDIFYNLNKLEPAPGDIIFFWLNNPLPKSLPFFDVSDAFAPPQDYRELFVTRGNVNELGYKLLAEKTFNYLTENNFFQDEEFTYPAPPPPIHRYGIPTQGESL